MTDTQFLQKILIPDFANFVAQSRGPKVFELRNKVRKVGVLVSRQRLNKYILFFLALLPGLAYSSASSQHTDPVAPVIFWVTVLFIFGVMGRYLARRFHQPGVLGELLMGIVVGNVFYFCGSQLAVILREGPAIFDIMRYLLAGDTLSQAVKLSIPDPHYGWQVMAALHGDNGFDLIKVAYVLDVFSRYGVIFLLFMVGLDSSIEELKQTGRESIQVAIIGVLAPIILALLTMYILMPHSSFKTNLFVAATLSATSVGITARVLKEMKKIRTREARTILGAAMLDDIFGLIILAIVSSIVVSGIVDMAEISTTILLAIVFFAISLLIGPWLIRRAVTSFRFLELWEAKLFIAFIFVMILAWAATLVQLATIIGAFAAGIIIHDGFFTDERGHSNTTSIKNLVAPFEAVFAPLFFILVGIQVKIETFYDWHVLMVASGLIIAAILGKLVSGFGGNRRDDRLLIGIGMLPRGEVGLVFASIGITLGVISAQLFSAIILMVVVTTLITPPGLKRAMLIRGSIMQPKQENVLIDVRRALDEDIGSGDVTARLLPAKCFVSAEIISREAMVVCGRSWVDTVFSEVDPTITIQWLVEEGEWLDKPTTLCKIEGLARSLLTAERSALNFLQTLSATATQTHHYLQKLKGSQTRLLDTRKTLPGLRMAQKYAVACAGGVNHRLGLYDAFLIKENHIKASGSIQGAVEAARASAPNLFVEIEVETLAELQEARSAKPDRILLDNFSNAMLIEAVAINQPKNCELEASGNINLATIASVAATGVDYISVGAITKSVQAIDLSLLIKSELIK